MIKEKGETVWCAANEQNLYFPSLFREIILTKLGKDTKKACREILPHSLLSSNLHCSMTGNCKRKTTQKQHDLECVSEMMLERNDCLILYFFMGRIWLENWFYQLLLWIWWKKLCVTRRQNDWTADSNNNKKLESKISITEREQL